MWFCVARKATQVMRRKKSEVEPQICTGLICILGAGYYHHFLQKHLSMHSYAALHEKLSKASQMDTATLTRTEVNLNAGIPQFTDGGLVNCVLMFITFF